MPVELREKALRIVQALREHFGPPKRPSLPPVDELVCTIISQNTNDRLRDIAFERLKARFPTWEDVMKASEQEIADTIQIAGLGPDKARYIREALRTIHQSQGALSLDFLRDKSPQEARQWLTQLRGVGPKTASIVLLFSLGKPAFPVDTHVYRVTGRLGLRPPMSVEKAHQWLEALFPPEWYYEAHLLLIQLGRTYCRPRNPRCPLCPVREWCDYYRQEAQETKEKDKDSEKTSQSRTK